MGKIMTTTKTMNIKKKTKKFKTILEDGFKKEKIKIKKKSLIMIDKKLKILKTMDNKENID